MTPALLVASGFSCSGQGSGAGNGPAASGGSSTGGASSVMGGVLATGGSTSSGTGGGIIAPASGGANGVGTGGAPATGGSGTGGTVRGTGGGAGTARGTGGAGGSFDDGHLFTDAGLVTFSGGATGTDAAVSASTDAASDGPPGSGHMATCSIPAVGLTAVFTQTGIDVTVVITATKCPAGNHVVQIHDGFSCDSAATQGGVWGGKRGDGIGSISCSSAQQGTLTYTRTGTDPTLNWTVGDHSTKTDVTLHPMMLESNCGTFF